MTAVHRLTRRDARRVAVALYRAEMAVWPGAGELRPWQVSTAAWLGLEPTVGGHH